MQRSIYFYQMVDLFSDQKIGNTDVIAIWNGLRKSAKSKNPYMSHGSGEVSRLWIDSHTNFPLQARYGKTRKTGLPQIEGGGNFRAIPVSNNEGINDLCHLSIFSNAVVGFEFNFYGPRLSGFSRYIEEKTGSKVKFVPLLDSSAIERLNNLSIIKSFEFKVKSEKLTELQMKNSSVATAIKSLGTEAHDIEIVMRAKPKSDDSLSPSILSMVKKLVIGSDPNENLKKLKVKGIAENGSIDEIDFLKEILVSKRSVLAVDKATRAVQQASAYSAIQGAHNDLKEKIASALG